MVEQKINYGKGVELEIIGRMARAGNDCYIPVSDVRGIDFIIRQNKECFGFQIKARMDESRAFIIHDFDKCESDFFIFCYVGDNGITDDKFWIVPRADFIDLTESQTNQNNTRRIRMTDKKSKKHQHFSDFGGGQLRIQIGKILGLMQVAPNLKWFKQKQERQGQLSLFPDLDF